MAIVYRNLSRHFSYGIIVKVETYQYSTSHFREGAVIGQYVEVREGGCIGVTSSVFEGDYCKWREAPDYTLV